MLHEGHGWGNGGDGSDGSEVDIQELNRSLLHCLLVHNEDLLLLVPVSPKRL